MLNVFIIYFSKLQKPYRWIAKLSKTTALSTLLTIRGARYASFWSFATLRSGHFTVPVGFNSLNLQFRQHIKFSFFFYDCKRTRTTS